MDRLSSLPDPIIHHILSLMDTKYAVQTCLLSTKWKHQWTEVHSLNFNRNVFTSWDHFSKFVFCVLRYHKPFKLRKLKLQCNASRLDPVLYRIYMYGKLYGFEVFETDFSDISLLLPRLKDFPTLRTLKIGPAGEHTGNSLNPCVFAFLTTLQLFKVSFSWEDRNYDLSGCLKLENLLLIECKVSYLKNFNISAPWLVNLTISDSFEGLKKLVVCAPRLKYFNFRRKNPDLVLNIDECTTLDVLTSNFFPPGSHPEKLNEYISSLIRFVEGLCQAKSLTISLNRPNGKAKLLHNTLDAETKLVVLRKGIRKELLFALAEAGHYLSKGSFSPDFQQLLHFSVAGSNQAV